MRPITPDTVLRPGMLFRTAGSRRTAPCSGRITKVNRVNVLFDSLWMNGEVLRLSLPRSEFNGGVFVLENPTPCTL